ncbi:hypothetical protein Taro_029484 [Colocasia esculenta]|uniref:Mechanosensitive ion channel protein n=1 Tax=Colocasia esculenta TaxID=4460 RepID=A0A843VV13_COLES|nr:hypothetical protein [Colocasia esculenta]
MDSNREDMQLQQQQTELVLVISGEDPPLMRSSSANDVLGADARKTSALPVTGPSSSSSDTGKSSPGHGKPPVAPVRPQAAALLRQRRSLSRPKSRFVEQSPPRAPGPGEDHPSSRDSHSSRIGGGSPASTATPRAAADEDEEEDEEDVYRKERRDKDAQKKKRRTLCSFWALLEWSILLSAAACLATSLSVRRLQGFGLWDLEIWKWCVMAIVVCCGRLLTEWLVVLLVFMVERNFLLKKKVLYFVYGIRNSVRVCVWLGLVLLSWSLLINRGAVRRPAGAGRALDMVTKAMVTLLVGSVVWLVKTLLVKLLAASFHVNTFFDRIQESIFHQYVLQTLSGQLVMELAERVGSSKSSGQLSFRSTGKGKGKGKEGEEHGVIDVGKLHRLRPEKVSAWTMKGLISSVRGSGFLTISDAIDHSTNDEVGGEKKDKEITGEWEARAAARQIFKNVAKPDSKYIEEEDLLRFLSKEEVDIIFPQFEGASETGKIKKSAFKNWVVKAYLDRKSLAHSLNDTKTAVNQLHKLISAIAIVVIIMISLLIMGIATTKVFVFISSQLLLVVFVFGNTCKTAFEAIIFVFIMHPFDVGDRCVIDGVQLTYNNPMFQLCCHPQMVVEEMNILTTVFLRYDNEKIYYPNSVLAIKPISNFYRSPDMNDSVEFSIDFATTVETIGALKTRIKSYIDSKPQHWHPKHSVVVKEIINVNKINMALYVLHTMNHQNIPEKNARKTELMLELKKIFEELSIRYKLLPQQVHLSYTEPTMPPLTLGR